MNDDLPTPFHAGELALQERAGVRERLHASAARFIRDAMPDQHREFFAKLPTLIVGGLDGARQPWASMLAGPPGFMQSPDARHLVIGTLPRADDPLHAAVRVGSPVGVLGIEPHTRRRNRMNGTVVAVTASGFTVEVDQSYGNCPQYIQARAPSVARRDAGFAHAIEGGAVLSAQARALVQNTDTLFIATAAADARGHGGAAGVDVSHRGGKAGFVRVSGDDVQTVLTMPDFRGNNFFNTLGNVVTNPRVGVLVVDYARGHLLQVIGEARVLFDEDQVRGYPGALRLLQIFVTGSRWYERALPLVWSEPVFAAQLSATGPWTAR